MQTDLTATRDAIEIITGGWRAQALYVAVKLGVPDHIDAGRATTAELAEATGADPEGVHRLMRLLVAMGVFAGDGESGYRNTDVARVLLDRPGTLRDMCLLYGEEFYTAWAHAEHAIRTVTAGWDVAFGEPLYTYLDSRPEAADRFQAAMKAGNLFFDYVPDVIDFAGKHVVDVGGGAGQLLGTILAAVPDARGTLIDREHVAPIAEQKLAGLGDRVRVVGGDMFAAVPEGGDVYLLCRVLAGWSDDAVVGLFENCRAGLSGPDARVVILERLVVDEGATVLPSLWDLHLLMTNGGRHRTLDRFVGMLERAGLVVERVADLPMETSAIIAKQA
ncbi:methyltransferase [Actinokineospora fastidiosa]|uniref:Phenazine-specific methyltransferase n=1 Tax=Actinokineospora fastidiosa TaxID=1816 RepID=A0A918GS03_9PSEU|nr:methyltransferase [Actinokineospora fastidiosa]GGS56415.1 phenazine-specific methyltransferase [Actinokineospora fastidiosa]